MIGLILFMFIFGLTSLVLFVIEIDKALPDSTFNSSVKRSLALHRFIEANPKATLSDLERLEKELQNDKTRS